jgi:hypothetical protein
MYKDFIILFSSSVAPAAWLSDVESGRQAVDSAARGVTAQWKNYCARTPRSPQPGRRDSLLSGVTEVFVAGSTENRGALPVRTKQQFLVERPTGVVF